MREVDFDDEEKNKPLEYQAEKPMDELLMKIIETLQRPGTIMFVVKAGMNGAIMSEGFVCWKIPYRWIQRLVSKGYLDQQVASRSTVACMGWIEYVVTPDGDQALHVHRSR